jgi:hypothetical protein
VRYRPRRKHGQGLVIAQPAHALLDGAQVDLGGNIAIKRIHKDQGIVQIGNGLEQKVGHQLHVRPQGAQQGAQHDALDAAEGMIGHHHQAALARDAGQVGLGHQGLDVHDLEHPLHEVLARIGFRGGIVNLVDAVDGQHLLHRAAHDGKHALLQRILDKGPQIHHGFALRAKGSGHSTPTGFQPE